jgi:hypothetical protein
MFVSPLSAVINVEAAVYSVHTMDLAESGELYNNIILGLHNKTLSAVLVGLS